MGSEGRAGKVRRIKSEAPRRFKETLIKSQSQNEQRFNQYFLKTSDFLVSQT